MSSNNSTFVKITNSQIYEKLMEQDTKLDNIVDAHRVLQVKTSSNSRLIIGAYGFSMAILGFLVSHITN